MRPSNEWFEQTQRRVTGRQPTLSERIASLRNHGKLLNVLIPAAFVAVVPMLVLHHILEEQNLPLYVFAGIGAVVFIAVFLQLTFRETSRPSPTKKRRGAPPRRCLLTVWEKSMDTHLATRTIMRSPMLAFGLSIAAFGVWVSPVHADTQAAIAELEMKANSCKSAAVQTSATMNCARLCASYVARLQIPRGLKPGDEQMMLDGCETLYSEVDLDASMAPAGEADALVEDARAKSKACGADTSGSREARTCVRACAGVTNSVANARQITADFLQTQREYCDTAYVAAGFSLAAETPMPPTVSERVSGMSAKQEYCSAQLSGMTCSRYDQMNPEHGCYTARMCESQCAQTDLAAKIETTRDRMERIKGTQALTSCERNYKATQQFVGQ